MTVPAQPQQPFSALAKFLITMGVIVVVGAAYFGMKALGDTTRIGLSLKTQPELQQGLMVYWTFDGADMDFSSTTGEVLDVSGNNKRGNMVNFE